MSVLIIAEVGVNHNGNLEDAKQLIDVAADAGADIVKFQSFRAENLTTKGAPKAIYQQQNTIKSQSQFEMLKSLELNEKMHEILVNHCKEKKIEFLSTAFDIENLNILKKIGLKRFKIPSGEIDNLPYLRHIGSFKRPIIMSTGMANMNEIENAIITLEKAGVPRKIMTLLHCNTEYPTPMEDVNLLAMQTIKNYFDVEIGYSDHTLGTEVSISAVALGATVIEKHLTLNKNLPGPDHSASIEGHEFSELVKAIRNIEVALGNNIKCPSPSELKNKVVARKSIVASKKIKSGEKFNSKNITTKRPGVGINPMKWDEIIGKIAIRNFEKDEMIEI